jgi:cyanobactin maturation PatA/PatG family protease
MDLTGAPLKYSNWGESYQGHAILAPGENILGAMPGGGRISRSGTSFATAIVSGVAALLLSIQLKRGISPDPLVARRAILSSATSCDQQPATDCRLLLGGRLNVVEALTHLIKGEEKQMSDQNNSPGAERIISDEAAALGIDQQQKDVVVQQATSSQKPISQSIIPSSLGASIVASGQVAPSGETTACGCGAASPPSLVYVLGQIGYDFVSAARRDSFIQQGLDNPDDPAQMLAFLSQRPEDATALTWILMQEGTVIYAIRPAGAFAAQIYLRLREFLNSQISEGAERVSIPGYTSGSATLHNGQAVPVIYPELRGMFSWTTQALVKAAVGEASDEEGQQGEYESRAEEVTNFLERVYYEIRNFGIAPQERAINFAATNAFQIDHVYRDAIRARMSLDRIEVERSPICRPESDCWDVKLTFFDPSRRLERARIVYRFTVDVSDIIPISIGKVRRWSVY